MILLIVGSYLSANTQFKIQGDRFFYFNLASVILISYLQYMNSVKKSLGGKKSLIFLKENYSYGFVFSSHLLSKPMYESARSFLYKVV
jgi:hypothetical protein